MPIRPWPWRLFAAGWRRMRVIKRLPSRDLPLGEAAFRDWQQAHPLNQRPLFIVASALSLIEEPKTTCLQGPEVVDRIVRREHRHLIKEAEKRGLRELGLVLPKVLAAITKGLTWHQLNTLAERPGFEGILPEYDTLRKTSVWRKNADGSEILPGLELDILAACLLAQVLDRGDDKPGVWQYEALAVAEDPKDASSRFGRLIKDTTDHTMTNGLALPVPQSAVEAMSFVQKEGGRLNWWHLETANTDYHHVHQAHGRALARDAIRYMRAQEAPHVLRCIVEAMLSRPQSWEEITVAAGFMEEIGRAICSASKVTLSQQSKPAAGEIGPAGDSIGDSKRKGLQVFPVSP